MNEDQSYALELLQDPQSVYINMLMGKIAKPSWEQIKHIYIAEYLDDTKDYVKEKRMTPQEIFDYKTTWLKGCRNISTFHTDLKYDAKAWCKANLKQHQWSFCEFTDVYEHSIYFETADMKDNFERSI